MIRVPVSLASSAPLGTVLSLARSCFVRIRRSTRVERRGWRRHELAPSFAVLNLGAMSRLLMVGVVPFLGTFAGPPGATTPACEAPIAERTRATTILVLNRDGRVVCRQSYLILAESLVEKTMDFLAPCRSALILINRRYVNAGGRTDRYRCRTPMPATTHDMSERTSASLPAGAIGRRAAAHADAA